MEKELDSFDKKAIEALELLLERLLSALKNGLMDSKEATRAISEIIDRKNMIQVGYTKLRAPDASPVFDMSEPPRETSQISPEMLEAWSNPPDGATDV